MNPAESPSELDVLLAALEHCLDIPVVPGELPNWSADVAEAAAALDPALRRLLDEVHPEQYERIAEDDPELLPRVALLKVTDRQLAAELDWVRAQSERLDRYADEIEPSENRVAKQVDELVERGLKLISSVRRQVTAVSTWQAEALYRDRGEAD